MTSPERPRVRALDGLRGLAVLAVVLFHLGLTAVPGGLLGVDVFFVLSGFLITGLLVSERRRAGYISLRTFWVRRWRRLLPALLLTLVAVAVLAQLFSDPAQVAGIRDEAVATLAYVSNWQAILAGHSYFDVVAPSPLRHTWSLGVEEQFYVVWPLVAVLVLRRSERLLFVVAVAGAAVSAGLQVGLAETGVGLDRLYYGTDTRVQALLIGAALAVALHGRAPLRQRARHGIGLLGLAATVGLVVLVTSVSGTAGWLYRGGFTLVALATAAVVAAATTVPTGLLARAFSVRPLAYLGRISYGVYLWHWPVVVYLTPARLPLSGAALALARVGVTLLVAAVSFHFVEQPIRRGGLRAFLSRTRPAAGPRRRFVPRLDPRLVVPAAVGVLVAVLLVAPLPTSSPETNLAAFAQSTVPSPPPPAAPDAQTDSETDGAAPAPTPTASGDPLLAPAVARKGPLRVLLVGDSVAYTLGKGMEPAVDPSAVTFTNQGFLGCGIARGESRPLSQQPICRDWPQRWQQLVDTFRPDVTLVLPSIWDTFDRRRDKTWEKPGQPAYDAYLTSEIDLGMRILTSRGGRVALLSAPCDDLTLANGTGTTRLPADEATRMARLQALTQASLARYPGRTVQVPFADLICPAGAFVRRLDGRSLREPDGIHLENYAGELFVRQQLPPVLQWLRTPVRQSTSPVSPLRPLSPVSPISPVSAVQG
ncbi:MAG: hypothetical protein QOJ32_144 [Frankiaceae bacterium]|nr:hypothetical protein [Frankiaceae bacterium]MDQ1633335.1 hypothetical protein [Frankiaceae bacterium]